MKFSHDDGSELLKKFDISYPYCGFDLPGGWSSLVERLIERLISMGWDRDLHQVKCKFGGLRFYIGEETHEMHEEISRAEEESFNICEECGGDAKLSKHESVVFTLCESHTQEFLAWKEKKR